MTDLPARLAQTSRALGILAAHTRALQAHGLDLPVTPLRETGQTLRALADELDRPTITQCALCSAEPVARPDQSADVIEGRFCGGCIARCLDDTGHQHWCPIDAHARDLDHHEEASC